MKLTIIIPCYNEDKYIEKVIASVNSQQLSDKQIIVVDDGSKDGTKEKLLKLIKKTEQAFSAENEDISKYPSKINIFTKNHI